MFDLYNTKEKLEKLAARPDIDTICAFDYHKLKSDALAPRGLSFDDFHPEVKGIKIPQLWYIRRREADHEVMENDFWLFKFANNSYIQIHYYYHLLYSHPY